MAVNRIYHPSFKWMETLIDQLPLAPVDLAARLKHVFQMPAPDGTRALHLLIEETFALIEKQVPELISEVAQARTRFQQKGPDFDQAPESLLKD